MIESTAAGLIERLSAFGVKARRSRKWLRVELIVGADATIGKVYGAEALIELLERSGTSIHNYRCGPKRKVELGPAADDREVRNVLNGIHETGNFQDIRILGDALRDAGCQDPDVLSHCNLPTHYPDSWLYFLLWNDGIFDQPTEQLVKTVVNKVGELQRTAMVVNHLMAVRKLTSREIAMMIANQDAVIETARFVRRQWELLYAPSPIWNRMLGGYISAETAEREFAHINNVAAYVRTEW